MAKSDVFNIVGIVTDGNGVTKVRFGNDLAQRVKILAKHGATRVDFIEVAGLSKLEALKAMQSNEMFADANDQALIADKVADYEKAAAKGEKRVAGPSLEAIKARAKNKASTSVADVLGAVTE